MKHATLVWRSTLGACSDLGTHPVSGGSASLAARVRCRLREAWSLVSGTAEAWLDDQAPSLGAALAYYTLFSLAPFLLMVISIAGLVFGAEAVRGELLGQLRGTLGTDSARAIEQLLASVSEPAQSAASAGIGAVFLLAGATAVFGELQNAMDRIWRAPPQGGAGGLWRLLRTRLLSIGMICGIAFLLMVSLVLGTVMVALGTWWGRHMPGWQFLALALNEAATFALTTALFAFIYKVLPRVSVAWRDVWLGAGVTAVLFTLGKALISLYLGSTNVVSGFGAAGSLIVLLVWVYYSAQVFLLGAEFTWVYAQHFGSGRDDALAGGDATVLPVSVAC